MGQPQPLINDTPLSVAVSPTRRAVVDDEWEYEYDPTETEDLYFTLDLTTHVPDALVSKDESGNVIDQTLPGIAGDEENIDAAPTEEDSEEEEDDNDSNDRAQSIAQHRLQFLDLHTNNPLIKFDDGFYSCYWSTDLGTQVHVAQAGVVPKTRHSGTVLDIVALSQTRLIGKPVSLKPKNGPSKVATEGFAAASPIEIDDDGDSEDGTRESAEPARTAPLGTPGEPLVIPREECKSIAAEKQASFLERLSRIKLKKGENDPIPIYSIKIYKEPVNKEEIKQRGQEAEAQRRKLAKDEALAAKMERPRKRRKRLTAAEKGVALPEGTVLSYGGRPGREAIASVVGYNDDEPAPLVRYGGKLGRGTIAASIGFQDEQPVPGPSRRRTRTHTLPASQEDV